MLKHFTLFMFKVFGWKINGAFPSHIRKGILVAAPHTSNWDFVFAIAFFYKLKIPFRYTIKQEWLKRFFIGNIMNKSGAIGVDRSKHANMVDAIAELFETNDDIIIVVQPEGTRKLAKKWKTGFYQVALKANVPLILGSLDYRKKIAYIGPSFMPTGDYYKDMEILKEFYKDITPKRPENFCLEIYDPADQKESKGS